MKETTRWPIVFVLFSIQEIIDNILVMYTGTSDVTMRLIILLSFWVFGEPLDIKVKYSRTWR